jgi:hypothetical protein
VAPRQPLRLELSRSPDGSPIDGAWWPQTADIDIELADLVDHFPDHLGTVYRVLYSKPDWTGRPRTVASRATDPLNRLTGAQRLWRFSSTAPAGDEIVDQWNDTGGNWWQGSRAPSFRHPVGSEDNDRSDPAGKAGM